MESYVDEIARRFNNRDNPYLLRDTLIRLIKAQNLSYSQLIAE
jgi:hypothetical protein